MNIICLKDKNYIEFDELVTPTLKDNSVLGLSFDLDDSLIQSVLSLEIRPFLKEIFNSIDCKNKNKNIKILSGTYNGMRYLNYFFLDGELIKVVNLKSFVSTFYKLLSDNNLLNKSHLFNSIDFAYENDKYLSYLDSYYNPVHVNDSGFYLNGIELKDDDSFIVTNIEGVLSHIDFLDDFKELISFLKIDGIKINFSFTPGSTNVFDIVGDFYYMRDGKILSEFEVEYAQGLLNNDSQYTVYNNYEDYKLFLIIDHYHELGLRINKFYNNFSNKELSFDEFNEKFNEYIKYNLKRCHIESDLEDNHSFHFLKSSTLSKFISLM